MKPAEYEGPGRDSAQHGMGNTRLRFCAASGGFRGERRRERRAIIVAAVRLRFAALCRTTQVIRRQSRSIEQRPPEYRRVWLGCFQYSWYGRLLQHSFVPRLTPTQPRRVPVPVKFEAEKTQKGFAQARDVEAEGGRLDEGKTSVGRTTRETETRKRMYSQRWEHHREGRWDRTTVSRNRPGGIMDGGRWRTSSSEALRPRRRVSRLARYRLPLSPLLVRHITIIWFPHRPGSHWGSGMTGVGSQFLADRNQRRKTSKAGLVLLPGGSNLASKHCEEE
ncbi:hypothetical protein CMUS01_12527 [Colletotrichum musicola]|uniref:Uncharacterized protein n=1 Tax=Colletotrichum musicola TaxID=2175873 RepID=A0A8H6JL59_9PEZI|nr:hypothetical protein CMUS01_12527 [Colletotrichum musicola]